MSKKVDNLKKRSESLFGARTTLLSLWQEIAENFYPERADFTHQRYVGEEFADNLTTSYPILARRDLGDAINSMLRPRNQNWFSIGIRNSDDLSHDAKGWLERATMIQRRALYDPASKFVRATKETDHDYTAFGQGVVSVEMNHKKNSLMFRNWHLRDVAWCEDFDGSICEVYRKSKVTLATLNSEFKENISSQAKEKLKKNPMGKIEYCHSVLPSDRYDGDKEFTTPYVSIYFETETGHVLKEGASQTLIYVIPRWSTVSGSQYAYSPATVAALPDSRLIQAMTLSMLEAGEMATNPPMFARGDVFRGDIQRMASGISFLDLEPEQRVNDAIEFQPVDSRGIGLALQMSQGIQEMIAKAFYLDRLSLPAAGPDMTAFEVSQRVTEYIRRALPLFEPMEQDYNASLMEAAFELLLANGAFGPDNEIPEELGGADIEFNFESPLHEAIKKQKAQTLIEGIGLASQVEPIAPGSVKMIEGEEALAESLEAIGYPMNWIKDKEAMEEMKAAEASAAQNNNVIDQIKGAGEAATAVGQGAQALQSGGIQV